MKIAYVGAILILAGLTVALVIGESTVEVVVVATILAVVVAGLDWMCSRA